LFFGALDVQTLLIGTDLLPQKRAGMLTSAEQAIVAGAAAVLLGYLVGVKWGNRNADRRRPAAEWPSGTIVLVGLSVWALGTAAMIYFQIFVMATKLGSPAD